MAAGTGLDDCLAFVPLDAVPAAGPGSIHFRVLRGRDAIADCRAPACVVPASRREKDETIPLEVSEQMVNFAGFVDTLR